MHFLQKTYFARWDLKSKDFNFDPQFIQFTLFFCLLYRDETYNTDHRGICREFPLNKSQLQHRFRYPLTGHMKPKRLQQPVLLFRDQNHGYTDQMSLGETLNLIKYINIMFA